MLSTIADAPPGTRLEDLRPPALWPFNDLLANLSVSRAMLGAIPAEITLFVLSLRLSLFSLVFNVAMNSAESLYSTIFKVGDFVDRLAPPTTNSHI